MNVLLFHTEQKSYREKVKDLQITIPVDLWESTFTYGDPIKRIKNTNKLRTAKNIQLPITPMWKDVKSDYRVKETNIDRHDYLYYRDIKIKIVKYSVYPAIFLTIVLVFIFLSFLSKI